MALAALKRKPEPELKTYHATMLVTRTEEWCVEAESAEEARKLFASGQGTAAISASACSLKSRALRIEKGLI